MKICASATFGVESIVKSELEDLGYKDIYISNGRVFIDGDIKDVCLLNISLRTAERVFIEVGRFKAYSFEDLYQGVKKIDWAYYLSDFNKFPVYAKSIKSILASPSDIQKITKKAIVDVLNKFRGNDLSTKIIEDGPVVPIEVVIRDDEVVISLDTTGEGLFKRGYRLEHGKAPLKETLAAALLKLSNFDSQTLVDPFCGSGTILIEAAMMARNIDPGLNREFLFTDWSFVDRNIFENIIDERKKLINFSKPLLLQGSDIDSSCIKIAKENAKRAGVSEDILFVTQDARRFHPMLPTGLLITNPPYGNRLGEKEELNKLMKQLGHKFLKLPNWNSGILTSIEEFEKVYGMKSYKKRKLFNGGIKTYFYQFGK